ncbi:MAG: threonine/serine exporter family protein [Clostridiales bacterium]|nr:threonine/serine exporter family protein [Clostridiales bacterium]
MEARIIPALDSAALAARTILESNGETYRAEETALRMCIAFGLKDPQIMAFPTGYVLSAIIDTQRETRVYRIQERGIRLDRIDAVNSISRKAVKGQIGPEAAYEELKALRGLPALNWWRAGLYYALAAAFFTVMFGGGFTEFFMSFLIGFLVQTLQIPLSLRQVPVQLRSFFLGFIAALAAVLLQELIPARQEPLITGVIMPLLPGLALTNAVRDTIRGDLISGLGRGAEALISAVMLSAGVAIALLLRGALWTA